MMRHSKPLKQMSRHEMLKELSKLTRKELKLLFTMFDAYEENRVAVVEQAGQELRPYSIQTFFNCRSVSR